MLPARPSPVAELTDIFDVYTAHTSSGVLLYTTTRPSPPGCATPPSNALMSLQSIAMASSGWRSKTVMGLIFPRARFSRSATTAFLPMVTGTEFGLWTLMVVRYCVTEALAKYELTGPTSGEHAYLATYWNGANAAPPAPDAPARYEAKLAVTAKASTSPILTRRFPPIASPPSRAGLAHRRD